MSTSSPTAVNSRPSIPHRQADDGISEPGMGKTRLWALLAVIIAGVIPHGAAAETLKIASPIRGSWEGAIPELGKQAGLFRKSRSRHPLHPRRRRDPADRHVGLGRYRPERGCARQPGG